MLVQLLVGEQRLARQRRSGELGALGYQRLAKLDKAAGPAVDRLVPAAEQPPEE